MRGNWILFENFPLYLFIYFKFWPCPTACGSLGPQAGSKFTFLALEAGVLTTELPENSGCWLFKFWPGEAIKKVLVASLAFLDFPQQQSINSYPRASGVCMTPPMAASSVLFICLEAAVKPLRLCCITAHLPCGSEVTPEFCAPESSISSHFSEGKLGSCVRPCSWGILELFFPFQFFLFSLAHFVSLGKRKNYQAHLTHHCYQEVSKKVFLVNVIKC